MPKVAIQRDYQQMIRHAGSADADYLRGICKKRGGCSKA